MPIKTCRLTFLLGIVLIAACAPQSTPGATALPAPTQTISPDPSETPGPAASASPSAQPDCSDSAVFVADVTIDDGTNLQPGQAFTKTWQLRNTGSCAWNTAYTLVFSGGDRMASPATVALGATPPNNTLNLSVDLVAPSSDGAFTGLYEIHNPQGQAIPIGLTKSMWVKITVGDVALLPQPTLPAATVTVGPHTPYPTSAPTAHPKGPCRPEPNANYTSQILALINTARTQAGVQRLSFNAQLAASAQAHSDDMACHNLLSHTGSNGSSIYDRIVAAGYSPAYWEEIIFGSGFPQQAFDWWMKDPPHRDGILDPKVTDFGAGFSYWAGSEYGSYYTVDFGRP